MQDEYTPEDHALVEQHRELIAEQLKAVVEGRDREQVRADLLAGGIPESSVDRIAHGLEEAARLVTITSKLRAGEDEGAIAKELSGKGLQDSEAKKFVGSVSRALFKFDQSPQMRKARAERNRARLGVTLIWVAILLCLLPLVMNRLHYPANVEWFSNRILWAFLSASVICALIGIGFMFLSIISGRKNQRQA